MKLARRTGWKIALLVALGTPVLAQDAPPTTRPVVTDAQFDEALTRAAAEKEGAAFAEPLRSVASRFREVPVSTEPGKATWHKVTLNRRGHRLDAVRFRVPDGERRAMAWAFLPPANLESWYILPLSGEMEGFKQFFRPSARSVLGNKAPPESKTLMLQSLPASSLQPGAEYLLWFRFRDEKPAPLHLAIALPPADEKAKPLNQSGVVKALGLTREGEDLGAVDLDTPTTQPLAQ